MIKLKNCQFVRLDLKLVRKLEYFRVVAAIGTIVFLISAFLPLISVTFFDQTASISLMDLYSALTRAGSQTAGDVTVPAGVYGILLTVILYPVTVALGLISIFRRRVGLAAGILGILCWIGSIVTLSGLQALQYTGLGIYVGFVGAIILLLASALKPRGTKLSAPSSPIPPPPPPP